MTRVKSSSMKYPTKPDIHKCRMDAVRRGGASRVTPPQDISTGPTGVYLEGMPPEVNIWQVFLARNLVHVSARPSIICCTEYIASLYIALSRPDVYCALIYIAPLYTLPSAALRRSRAGTLLPTPAFGARRCPTWRTLPQCASAEFREIVEMSTSLLQCYIKVLTF